MSGPEMSNNYWPIWRYCALSAQFSEAYRAYASRPSQQHLERRAPDEVELFLICHALELALKGWLLFRAPGMTVKKLQHVYSHDLFKLASDVAPYYPAIGPFLPLIQAIGYNAEVNEVFSHRNYGYPDSEDKGIPVPMPLKPFAEFVVQCRFDLSMANDREHLQT